MMLKTQILFATSVAAVNVGSPTTGAAEPAEVGYKFYLMVNEMRMKIWNAWNFLNAWNYACF